MKKYYTKNKRGEDVEVSKELALELIKSGKKKYNDFVVEGGESDLPLDPLQFETPSKLRDKFRGLEKDSPNKIVEYLRRASFTQTDNKFNDTFKDVVSKVGGIGKFNQMLAVDIPEGISYNPKPIESATASQALMPRLSGGDAGVLGGVADVLTIPARAGLAGATSALGGGDFADVMRDIGEGRSGVVGSSIANDPTLPIGGLGATATKTALLKGATKLPALANPWVERGLSALGEGALMGGVSAIDNGMEGGAIGAGAGALIGGLLPPLGSVKKDLPNQLESVLKPQRTQRNMPAIDNILNKAKRDPNKTYEIGNLNQLMSNKELGYIPIDPSADIDAIRSHRFTPNVQIKGNLPDLQQVIEGAGRAKMPVDEYIRALNEKSTGLMNEGLESIERPFNLTGNVERVDVPNYKFFDGLNPKEELTTGVSNRDLSYSNIPEMFSAKINEYFATVDMPRAEREALMEKIYNIPAIQDFVSDKNMIDPIFTGKAQNIGTDEVKRSFINYDNLTNKYATEVGSYAKQDPKLTMDAEAGKIARDAFRGIKQDILKASTIPDRQYNTMNDIPILEMKSPMGFFESNDYDVIQPYIDETIIPKASKDYMLGSEAYSQTKPLLDLVENAELRTQNRYGGVGGSNVMDLWNKKDLMDAVTGALNPLTLGTAQKYVNPVTPTYSTISKASRYMDNPLLNLGEIVRGVPLPMLPTATIGGTQRVQELLPLQLYNQLNRTEDVETGDTTATTVRLPRLP